MTSVLPAQIALCQFLSMTNPTPSNCSNYLSDLPPQRFLSMPPRPALDNILHSSSKTSPVDASAYRTAIVYSHISTCKAANVAPNMDGGYPGKEPILTAESGRTPAIQPKKQMSRSFSGPTRPNSYRLDTKC